jgi:hypothetical protein
MSLSKYSAVLENGRILIRDAFPDLSEPVEHVHYWPTRWGKHDLTDFATGKPDDPAEIRVQRYGGTYFIRFPRCGFDIEFRLPGETKSVRCETVPVPRPKVRAGIELRWNNGRWYKRLKSGDVPVW